MVLADSDSEKYTKENGRISLKNAKWESMSIRTQG